MKSLGEDLTTTAGEHGGNTRIGRGIAFEHACDAAEQSLQVTALTRDPEPPVEGWLSEHFAFLGYWAHEIYRASGKGTNQVLGHSPGEYQMSSDSGCDARPTGNSFDLGIEAERCEPCPSINNHPGRELAIGFCPGCCDNEAGL